MEGEGEGRWRVGREEGEGEGFKDSNILKALQNFSLTMLYALTSPDFQKIFLFARIGHLKKLYLKDEDFGVARTRK